MHHSLTIKQPPKSASTTVMHCVLRSTIGVLLIIAVIVVLLYNIYKSPTPTPVILLTSDVNDRVSKLRIIVYLIKSCGLTG